MNLNNVEFIEKLQDSVSETFETMLFAEVTEKEMCDSLPEWAEKSVATSIEIIEPYELMIKLYFEQDHAVELVDMLYGDYDDKELDKITMDLVSECSNAVAGSFAIKLIDGDDVVKLGVPVPLKNGEIRKAREKSKDSIIILFEIDDRKIVFTIESNSTISDKVSKPDGLFSEYEGNGEVSKEQIFNKNFMVQFLKEQSTNLMKYERQAAIGNNVQGIVHNMNNQISGILGYAQLMRLDLDGLLLKEQSDPEILLSESKPVLENLNKRLNANLACIERFIDMINSLMNKSRFIQSEEFEVINLNELLKNEVDYIDVNKWFDKSVNLVGDFYDKELLVNVVPSYISQVLQNLVKNSVDAVYGLPNSTIEIKTGIDNKMVWFTVTDNGSGISEKVLPRIFEPFFTTKINNNGSKQVTSSGSGLGLYMCKELIALQSGYITIANTSKSGTTFKLEFNQE